MAENERDEKVARAYRALGAEEPPRALDEAILAAARRRPSRWGVPLSIAAVLVLAVGVTLRMLPRQPDAESVALAPQVMEAPRPAAPAAEQASQPARPAASEVAPARPPVARTEQAAAAGALSEEAARQNAAARTRADTLAADRPQPGAAAAPTAAPAAAVPGPRALASAKLAEPATPEAWLERIAELKKQGREREAEESLAEFKKRYPGYKIPEALTR